MAQAGLHGLAGLLLRRWMPGRRWLMLGIVLGNLIPDLDNLLVAVATLTGAAAEGLHRTFSHSLFTALAIIVLGYLAGALLARPKWANLGLGLGLGVALHILFDLLIWFNGVQILWPLSPWINLWSNTSPPEWWSQLMMPAEFLAFALFFGTLGVTARSARSGTHFQVRLRLWTMLQGLLFIVFTPLVFLMESRFMTIYGIFYLLSLFLALGVTIRMNGIIEKGGVAIPKPISARSI